VCDTIAAVGSVTGTGTTLFAKNSDRDYKEAQYLEWVRPARHGPGEKVRLTYQAIDQVSQTHGVLLSRPHWIWGAEMGANTHGLVIGNEAIFAKIAARSQPGLIGMDYVRLALERAAEVGEAIEVITTLLRRHGQGGNCGFGRTLTYHNSYLLADRQGAKVLETVDRDWAVVPIVGSGAISNAMTIESTFTASSETLRSRASEAGLHEEGTPFSFRAVFEDASRSVGGHHRRDRATRLLQELGTDIGVRDLFRILRDHVEGPSVDGRPGSRICAHRRENPIGQTTASWVSDLTPGKTVHWMTGTAAPCTGIFKPVFLEVGLPEHGTRPGAAADPLSLWWRHEELRRNLDEAHEGVVKSFHRERIELESEFLNRVAECPAIEDTATRARAEAVIENCWRQAWSFESRWLDRLRSPHDAFNSGPPGAN
jgi:secernin